MKNVVLKVKKLNKKYKDKKILSDVSFQLLAGESVRVIGDNDVGKTALIEIMMGIKRPTSGKVVYYTNGAKNQEDIQKFIGVQLQETEMFQNIRVKEVFRFFEEIYCMTDSRISEVIQMFNLTDCFNKNLNELSGGRKYKASLALAILHNPKIIFLDEPTLALDSEVRKEIWDIINKIKSQDKLLIISTHSKEAVKKYCDKILMVKQGGEVKLDATKSTYIDILL